MADSTSQTDPEQQPELKRVIGPWLLLLAVGVVLWALTAGTNRTI